EEADDTLCDALMGRGFKVRRENLYRMQKAAHLPAEAAQALQHGELDAALFFSPQSASLFAECVARDGLSTKGLVSICISANTAAALKDMVFLETRIAAAPN